MKSGSIVLTPMPQADGQWKNRLALVLCRVRPFDDFVVCGISSQVRYKVGECDEIIRPEDDDLVRSKLAVESLIRLGYVNTICPADIKGRLGEIDVARLARLLRRLSQFLESRARVAETR